MFWSDIAPRLMKVNYEMPVAEAELMAAGIRKAADLIDASSSNKRKIEPPKETRQSKKQKEKTSQEMQQVEYDGIYIENNDISVGTTIKRTALKYFNESKSRKLSARERKIMSNGLSSILDLVYHSNPSQDSDYSESDVLRIIWSPIFELLFPPNQHNLTVKTGETISVISQEHKQDTYSESTNIIAFKIDIRVIFKHHGEEIDVVSGEVANNDEASKIITDEGKLSRETKDAVDSILTLVETTAQAFNVQIGGSTCVIATQQLVGNGLYVYHPAYSFSLPSCIEDLESFGSTMQKLFSFQQHVITIANILEKAGIKKYSLNQQFGKHDEADKDDEATSILNWRRDTFYTPPKKKEARVPLVLFGSPSSGLVSRLLKAKYSEGEEGVVYDQFGWGKENDKWHNKITKETQDECPYSEE